MKKVSERDCACSMMHCQGYEQNKTRSSLFAINLDRVKGFSARNSASYGGLLSAGGAARFKRVTQALNLRSVIVRVRRINAQPVFHRI
jgi:hypothetical protein